jgi:hypothetical protein
MATPLELAEFAFNEIRESFPNLACRIDRKPAGGLDIELVFPEQPGLSFEVSLNLQNVDELHLNAPGLSVEWFPCTKPDVLTRYVDAVRGVIAGSHRILQYRRRGRLIKSYLQRPLGESWETIARYYPGIALPFLRCETTVVANLPAV